jgi:hypothetical protein
MCAEALPALLCLRLDERQEAEMPPGLRAELDDLERFSTTRFYGQLVEPILPVTFRTVTRHYVRCRDGTHVGWNCEHTAYAYTPLLPSLAVHACVQAIAGFCAPRSWRAAGAVEPAHTAADADP